MRKLSLLLANDNPNFLLLLGDALAAEGFEVATAASLEQVELVLATKQIDALLTDLQVGTSSGLDLLRRLRSADTTASLPIVVVSGRVGQEAKTVALASGADAFVDKPLEVKNLVKLVRELIRSRGSA